ncbi:hypothetical protein PGTUg99_002550 [Puccinia graminis f. sp. tritici]|uniref:Uncharacterized protein n=1 Tax=Puccinia graminis f. sp. tritici TaxID=56615 RepID=A0A5B0SKP7_PUCGR|nr:hypothetical protein PGTUg99_002550 [Puccinia graminis f. sp. tritici]
MGGAIAVHLHRPAKVKGDKHRNWSIVVRCTEESVGNFLKGSAKKLVKLGHRSFGRLNFAVLDEPPSRNKSTRASKPSKLTLAFLRLKQKQIPSAPSLDSQNTASMQQTRNVHSEPQWKRLSLWTDVFSTSLSSRLYETEGFLVI